VRHAGPLYKPEVLGDKTKKEVDTWQVLAGCFTDVSCDEIDAVPYEIAKHFWRVRWKTSSVFEILSQISYDTTP